MLSREEVMRLFAAAPNLRARALLMTTYAAGLRVSEVCALQLADIESAPDRMCIKVRQGKGAKDRYTMLSPQLLQTLRDYWHLCRPRIWLFPSPTGNGGIGKKGTDLFFQQSLKDIPKKQKQSLVKPLSYYAEQYKERDKSMAHAYRSGHYTLEQVGEYFGVSYATVSRAVKLLEGR